ncbi:MAG: ankyrin repeat domain-containing protein [Bacteroidota bacterium]|nr:ankyrin repeat domain-containing protein [Bacteroidota bacterium]MDP4253795.1 ankyrin repeat domain-containing protein [Bacteroidota bacterium]MDP4259605.1 ankyrin repeat domain-containing protein [Bacteroidota bacterium]
MPPLIPTEQWHALSLAIARGDAGQVKRLVEEQNLDVNAFLDTSSWIPILMDTLLSNGFVSETDRLELLRWLLERGANPNVCGKGGYNCLHIAVQQEKYLPALELMLGFDADVNVADADGSNIIYWAIQAFLLRRLEPDQRSALLRVIEKILSLGADLDHKNRFGMSARGWLEYSAPELKTLVARWESRKPSVRQPFTQQPVFPVNLHYPELALRIWKELVPASGPAGTVQGELLRAVELLREAAKNKENGNRKSNKRMAVFVRKTLVGSGVFEGKDNERIKADTRRLMKTSRPLQDDIYDHLVDSVCIYYNRNQTLIPYQAPKEA